MAGMCRGMVAIRGEARVWGCHEGSPYSNCCCLVLTRYQGGLRSSKIRPVEWTKWTSKGRGSQRPYSSTPTIDIPAEFGHAVLNWWIDIQPEFRQGTGERPPAVYDTGPATSTDVWAPLRKGGPNGLVCVLTILVWWGQCAGVHSQWHEDMLPLWKATVVDVTRCMERMLVSAPACKQAGKVTPDSRERKR